MKRLVVTVIFPIALFSLDISSYVGNLQDLLKNNTHDIMENGKLNAMESLSDYILNKSGAGVNIIGGDMLQVCYNYKPKPIRNFDFSFNICKMIGSDNLDPCSLAPNLESLGYYKKTRKVDLSDFCTSIFGEKPQFQISVNDNIKKVNTTKYGSSQEDKDGKKIESPNKDISKTSLGLKNAEDNNNAIVKKAITNNDYRTFEILKEVVETSSEDQTKNVDFSQINVEYETYEDYSKSLESQADIYSSFNERLNIDRYKQSVLSQLRLVKEDDKASISTQKEAIIQKALEDYREILRKYEEIEIKRSRVLDINIDDSDRIVYPTQEVVSRYNKEARARVVYRIEKQKKAEATVIANVRKKVLRLESLCELELKKTLIHSEEFDEEEERKKIINRLNEATKD